MANGDTKTEAMLNVLGNGGTGDEFRGCCNTKTQQYILDAIDRINSIQPGGGEDFIGATSTTAGVHGLVPAPAAGDQDKVLKGDGTWAEISEGGGAKELTSDDFNWNLSLNSATEPYDCVALWLLEPGIYIDNDPNVYIALWSGPYGLTGVADGTFIINEENLYKHIIFHSSTLGGLREYLVRSDTGVRNGDMKEFLRDSNIVQTTGTSTTNIMSQKAVTDALASAGGGGITELTSADYNWPVSDPQGIAYWLLDDGVYYAASGVRFYYGSASSQWNAAERVFIVETDGSSYKTATSLEPHQINYYRNNVSTGDNTSGYPYTVLTTNSVVQTTGTSTSNVMSQNAATSMVFADAGTNQIVQIGSGASSTGTLGVAIGGASNTSGNYGVSIGYNSGAKLNGVAIGDGAKGGTSLSHAEAIAVGYDAQALARGSVALGANSATSSVGEMNIGSSDTTYGYNSTNYRLLSGVHDPVNAHDAATKGYVDAHSGGGSSPIKLLTDADYNYDSSGGGGDYDCVALWLLEDGYYAIDPVSYPNVLANSDDQYRIDPGAIISIYEENQTMKAIDVLTFMNVSSGFICFQTDPRDGSAIDTIELTLIDIQDAISTTGEINNRIQISNAVPTTTTWANEVGCLYSCTANGKLYMCTAIDDSDPDNTVYTWTAIN